MSNLGVMMVQAELCWQDPAENRERLERQIIEAIDSQSASKGVDLILLPETFSTGFLGDFKREPETMDGATVNWMQQLASRLDSAIGGSIVIGENDARFNRFLFATPGGSLQYYDKRHLFTLAGEHQTYTAGNQKLVVEIKGWRVCPLICYDLRFPVWSRNVEDYDLLLYVANFPAKRAEAWKNLLIARAIENLAYTIGVNRVGTDGKGHYYSGDTSLIDFEGQVLYRITHREGVFTTQLSFADQQAFRQRLAFLNDRDEFGIKDKEQA